MTDDGVTIEFLSRDRLAENEFEDKLDIVIDKVKNNAVLVLEESWTPDEKRQLIQNSLEEVDEDFPGVEFMGLETGNTKLHKAKRMLLNALMKDEYRRGLTIVGNSRVMEKIKEERDSVSFLAKLEEN